MYEFNGVKVALLTEDSNILTYLRDDRPDLFMANKWDLPGGGREADENPMQTIQREVEEEFNISLLPEQIIHQRDYPSERFPGTMSVFMVATLSSMQIEDIKFGTEGQCYQIIPIDEWLILRNAVLDLQNRLRNYLEEQIEAA